jgi:hypothetical protein
MHKKVLDWQLVVFGVAGLVVLNALSKQKWCGPTCQVLLSDARGTLVQDVLTGAVYWL